MTRLLYTRTLGVMLAASACLFAGPAQAAQGLHPYFVVDGPLDPAERGARSRSLEAEAARSGDTKSEARHAAMACLFETLATNDPRMTSASCANLRRLAARTGLLDVQIVIDSIPAELALKFFNFPAAERMLAAIIARAASLDAASPDSRTLRRVLVQHAIALAELARYDQATAEFPRSRDEGRRGGD